MPTQRLSKSQLNTDVPYRNAAEAVWHAFFQFGLSDVVIDQQQHKVTGSKGMSASSYGKTYIATLESRPEGLLISLLGEEQVPGTLDFGKGKRQVAELIDRIALQLEQADKTPEAYSRAVELEPVNRAAPIASPTSAPKTMFGAPGVPVYGVAAIPKRGTGVLLYGVMSLICCQIAAPFAIAYGFKALREYKTQDPGDKGLVITGMSLGVISCLLFVGWIIVILLGA